MSEIPTPQMRTCLKFELLWFWISDNIWNLNCLKTKQLLSAWNQYSKCPKSGHFCIPISDNNYRPKSGQKCPDLGHSTKLGRLPLKRFIKNFLYIKRPSLFVPRFVSRYQTLFSVLKWDKILPFSDVVWNPNCLRTGRFLERPKSERSDFGRILY